MVWKSGQWIPATSSGRSGAVYRVYFWSARRTVSTEYEFTDVCDVHEVLDWIDVNAAGREIEALVVVAECDVGRRDALGLRGVYLIGPLDHTIDPEEVGR
jgi:hypothetical protein